MFLQRVLHLKQIRLHIQIKSKYVFPHVVECSEEGLNNLKAFIVNKGIMVDDICTNTQINEEAIEHWKDFGKLKNNSIHDYIINLAEKYNLTVPQSRSLQSTVKIGVASGYLNNTNIIVKDSLITDIEPLVWDKQNNIFYIDTDGIHIKKTKTRQKCPDLSSDNTTTCLSFTKNRNISNIDKKWGKFLHSIYT